MKRSVRQNFLLNSICCNQISNILSSWASDLWKSLCYPELDMNDGLYKVKNHSKSDSSFPSLRNEIQ